MGFWDTVQTVIQRPSDNPQGLYYPKESAPAGESFEDSPIRSVEDIPQKTQLEIGNFHYKVLGDIEKLRKPIVFPKLEQNGGNKTDSSLEMCSLITDEDLYHKSPPIDLRSEYTKELKKYLGVKFAKRGGSSNTGGADCSGLVRGAMARAMLNVGKIGYPDLPGRKADADDLAREKYGYTRMIGTYKSDDNLLPGDIMCMKISKSSPYYEHVMVYLGDRQWIEASTSENKTIIINRNVQDGDGNNIFGEKFWQKNVIGGSHERVMVRWNYLEGK